MTTSVQSGAGSTEDLWQLDLTPVEEPLQDSETRSATHKPHLLEATSPLTLAEFIIGALESLEELVYTENCSVRLQFDSAVHHERAVELLGLIACSSYRGAKTEVRDIHHFESQLDRLETVVQSRLALAKREKLAGLPRLRRALMRPFNTLRPQIAKALNAAEQLKVPQGLSLPDLEQAWKIRQKLIAQIAELRRQWRSLMPLQSSSDKTSRTNMQAWHRSLNQLWSKPIPRPAATMPHASTNVSPSIDEVSRCFSDELLDEVEELRLQADLNHFLGGAVLKLCRSLNDANAKPQKLDLTKRWHELLKICRELHFNCGCLNYDLVSGLGATDPRAAESQELLENIREDLKLFLDLALKTKNAPSPQGSNVAQTEGKLVGEQACTSPNSGQAGTQGTPKSDPAKPLPPMVATVKISGEKGSPQILVNGMKTTPVRTRSLLAVYALRGDDESAELRNEEFVKLVLGPSSNKSAKSPSRTVKNKLTTGLEKCGYKYVPQGEVFRISGLKYESALSQEVVKTYLTSPPKK